MKKVEHKSIIVLKFGGSSVKDAQRFKSVAQRIKLYTHKYKVVVVVSAPGDLTDELIKMANEITPKPVPRELDMLLATGEQISIALLTMALRDIGVKTISLTGPQAGIYTDADYTKARIKYIKPDRILRNLEEHDVVVVAGFQGINPYDDIVTLGRGGSDLTAVALAYSLKTNCCEIFTDVDGIYTADPRIVPQAKKLKSISFDEMLELADVGSQVMMARSIEVAKKYNIKIHVRSSFSNQEGTMIDEKGIEDHVVTGIALDKNQVKLSILDVPDRPGVAAKIFGELAKNKINVDMIIQSAARGASNDISFTVSKSDFEVAKKILEEVAKDLMAKGVTYDTNVAKVSIVGVGMRTHPGIAAKMFEALAENGINIEMISTSDIKISCIIKEEHAEKAVKAIHKKFELHK
ncbi:MAG: aspartate kinase [bacterium]|nr:aspartate kinase [bacterium]